MTGFDAAQLEQIMRNGWRMTPATCAVKVTNGKWIPAPHLKQISNEIAPRIAKGGARIIVAMPARHGKSELISVNTPIWFLENWPDKFVINTTYGADLSEDFSYKVRSTFLDPDKQAFLSTRLDPRKQAVDRWLTTKGGGQMAVGLGGALTGRGGHLILVDDYVKNAEQAMSQSQRDSVWEWFRSTLYTRLEPGGSLVILATRWHIDDLIGRCLTEMPNENWHVINYPALALENDPLGREVGAPLWPERYSLEDLQRIQGTLGSYWWDAMFQQRPRASMSGMDIGDKLKIIPASQLPHQNRLLRKRIWDFAATQNDGDWTIGMLMSQEYGSETIYIEEIIREQLSPMQLEERVQNVGYADGENVEIVQEQEPGSSGKIVVDHYRNVVLPGFSYKAEKPSGKLEVRASAFIAAIESGRVKCVNGPWVPALVRELNGFPEPDHDDQISAGALGFKQFEQMNMRSPIFGKEALMRQKKAFINTGSARPRAGDDPNKFHSQSGAVWGNRNKYR